MTWGARILGPWGSATVEDRPTNIPQVAIDYDLGRWNDVTFQPGEEIPPEPNLVEIAVEAELQVLEAIDADPNYHIIEGTLVDKVDVDAAWYKLRVYLRSRGLAAKDTERIIGQRADSLARPDMVRQLRAYLRKLPKKRP